MDRNPSLKSADKCSHGQTWHHLANAKIVRRILSYCKYIKNTVYDSFYNISINVEIGISKLITENMFVFYNKYRALSNIHYNALTMNRASISGLVERFNDKNVILTVSPGWIGSTVLRSLFEDFPETTSTHERRLQYCHILAASMRNQRLAARFFLYAKAKHIASDHNRNYIETSHLFGQGFFEPCMALGFRPKLIFLNSPRRQTVLSLLSKKAIPGRTTNGRRFLIQPGDNAFVKLKGERRLSDYQLCYWYSIEMEMRAKLYQKYCLENGIGFSSIETSDLNDLDKISILIRDMDLLPGASTFQIRKKLSKKIGADCEPLETDRSVTVPRVDVQESELLDEIACYGRDSLLHERIAHIKKMHQHPNDVETYPPLRRADAELMRA